MYGILTTQVVILLELEQVLKDFWTQKTIEHLSNYLIRQKENIEMRMREWEKNHIFKYRIVDMV